VQDLLATLRTSGFSNLEEMEIKEEDVRFNLPAELVRTVGLHTIARV